VIPVALMPLGLFVAFIQTFVFILLSQLYLSEVSHAPHDDHGEHVEHGAHVADDSRSHGVTGQEVPSLAT
jgi:hypothetical protein